MTDTRVRIEELTDERNALHPLLKALLPRLPRVKNVEYTHGQGEMGADFVLSREDDAAQDLEYIGVIAKTTKVAQDYSDIERQIKECDLPRTFMAGKHKVRITEIWVVSTQHITKGAQEKIHEQYHNRKITFFEGERLARWVEQYVPTYWGLVDSRIGEYLSSFSADHLRQDQMLALLRCERPYYIQQDVTRLEASRYAQQKVRRAPEVISISSEVLSKRALLVEGGMGSGKTKLARHLALGFATPEKYKTHKCLPVWIAYSELLSKHAGSLLAAVQDVVPADVRASVDGDNGEYLVFVDGVDEVEAEPSERAAALLRIAEAATGGRVRVFVTSRFLDTTTEVPELHNAFHRYRIAPLTTGRVLEFLRTLCGDLSPSSRIAEDLKRSPLFKSLPKSPIAAILLAKLLHERARELPSNLTELYAKYTELMLGRWDIDKGLASQKEYEALDRILTDIARYVMENQVTSIPTAQARKFFDEYLEQRNLGLDPHELFQTMRDRCDMVVVDDRVGTFAFRHRTFAEYLLGRSLALRREAVVDDRAFELYWMNSYFFCVGTLRDCPDTLAQLSGLKCESKPQRWMKAFHLADFLLAGYSSNYSVVEDGIQRAVLDTVALFREMLAERETAPGSSPLRRLPEMQLLWLIQFSFRKSYSYEFFKKAIETAGLDISQSRGLSKEDKAYAMFFLNVAYIDLGAPDTFDFLLASLGDDLPIPISLALRHEAERLKRSPSAVLRKQQRHLRKLLRDNRPLQARIESLYDPPRPGPGQRVAAQPSTDQTATPLARRVTR